MDNNNDDSALIALLDSGENENISLAFLLAPSQGGKAFYTRLAQYENVAKAYCKAYQQHYQPENLSEYIPKFDFKNQLAIDDQPEIFSVQPYPWGGQGFGFGYTAARVLYIIQKSLLHSNLEAWMIAKKANAENYDQTWTHVIVQLWATYRIVEIEPLLLLIAKYWDASYEPIYYLGQIAYQRQDYDLARQYFEQFLTLLPANVSSLSQFRHYSQRRISEDSDQAPAKKAKNTLPLPWDNLRTIAALHDNPQYHALPPNSLEAHIFLAKIALHNNNINEAESQYLQAIALCPTHWLAPHFELGQLLLKYRHKTKAALRHLLQAEKNTLAAPYLNINDSAMSWQASADDYPELCQYLPQRYPILYAGINGQYIAAIFFAAAQKLRNNRKQQLIRAQLLARAAFWAATTLRKTKPNKNNNYIEADIFYRKQPKLLLEILAALANISHKKESKDFRIMAYSEVIKQLAAYPQHDKTLAVALTAKIQALWLHYRDKPQIRLLIQQHKNLLKTHCLWPNSPLFRLLRYLQLSF
jgi:tetratricopeptide (TPR) repeat protein